jgi:hypothetical protein
VTKLDDLKKRFAAIKGWSSLFRLVRETEDCLLQEVTEWHSFVQFTGGLH